MSCVEKRHVGHRTGSMLHHRFPNGFTDLFMDETDREVSILTDRAFRSLCVGDDAVYNDEFLYGYSPFSCHKPLVGDPHKKTHRKDSKKQGQNKNDKNHAQPWQQQQQKKISHMSSFLKALSATEQSCEGMLIKNGGMADSNGESWDKSALRSIQRELSEFSSGYHTNLTDGHYNNHRRHSSNKTGKDGALPSGKSSKIKNGKSTVKLRKLNIKNFFLHSEFSPFQTWRDFNRFPFSQEETVTSILPTDNIPKWYDLPFYKELTEAHRKETLHTEETQSCQKVEPPPPTAPKPMPPPPPPKLLPKPSATPAEKKSSSDGGEAVAAPWRRNRSRTTSAVPVNQPGIQSQENYSKIVEESLLSVKKEARSVEVKAIEEVSSLASTPFSICQLMTPLIPSRQPTETSEILQGVLSPSALDFPLRPLSETKVTPEPPVKRDSYKSLASSILFNLKDNRKRVKSRYSPPNFKTLELPECDIHSPQSDHFKDSQAGSESNASGLSTPAIFKDALTVCSPNQDSVDTPVAAFTKQDTGTPLSDDYLLSNLLQTKREAAGGEDTLISPFINSKKNKSPLAKRQNYPSLNLYKKASPVDSDMKYLQVPLSNGGPVHVDRPTETNELSPLTLNKDISPKPRPTNTGLSPRTLTSNKDGSPPTSLHAIENERLSSNIFVGERHSNLSDKAKRPGKSTKENVSGVQSASKQKDSGQTMSTMDVIRAAREAINAAKTKALSDAQSESRENPILKIEEINDKETAEVTKSMETFNSKRETESTPVAKTCAVKKEPPPVPKRNFAKADIEFSLDKQQIYNPDESTNVESRDAKLDLENESVSKEGKSKRIFSARQNHYIKHQRYAVTDDEPREECEEGNLKVNMRTEVGEETMSVREIKDNDNIVNDLPALKELERTSFGDRTLENAMNKLGVINIDEEARANTDLISRELRSIKKGMMSMRGNTSAKRELFTKIEKEQSKQGVFTKLDGNVRVNKALINDNYDKAKMALEEIISEREKRRNTVTEQDANPALDENAGDQSYATRAQQCKQAIMEGNEKHNGVTSAIKQRELKERLGDLRDHNQMRQILSQTEPRLGEPHRIGGRTALPGMDKLRNKQTTAKHVDDTLNDDCSQESAAFNFRHEAFKDSGGNLINETESKTFDAPPVPPRSKKGGNITDGSATKEVDETAGGLFNKDGKYENSEVHLNAMRSTGKQEADIQLQRTETTSDREKRDVADNAHFRGDENAINNLNKNAICISDIPCENSKAMVQETCKIKRKAPLRPDNLVKTDENITKNLVTEAETDNINGPTQEINVETEPRNIISPLLLVNGVNVPQSPPDQASLSSKSSYFSAESALHRNTETESNVYHSLENLVVEVEQADEECNVSRNMKKDLDKTEVDYYSLSDHEFELEVGKRPITSPEKEKEVPSNDSEERENTTAGKSGAADENNQTTLSPANTFSPTLGIPALFKVKDNTFSAKLKKTVQPWSPRGSLSGSERGEEELHPRKEVLPPATETISNSGTLIAAEIFKPKEILSKHTPPLLLSPLNVQNQSENLKKPQVGQFLTLPQEDDRFSGVSPSSEGVESLTTSTADTADEMGMKAGVPAEREPSNVPSEHSGSNCSGNEHQMVLPKPPAVLPKSEKAVLKAIKLTNRRIKKEEAQKSPHKSSQSSSKHRTDRHKGEKSEQKGSSSSRSSKSREEKQGGHHQSENHPSNELLIHESRGRTGENHLHERAEKNHNSRRQSRDSEDGKNQTEEAPPSVATERQGRSGERQTRNRSHKRHYSTDRVISTVPVYKAHVGERPLQRSQSIDRCLGERVERRLSADTSEGDKSHPRTQRIEKSIMDELQQRGRARDKASRDNPLRRSHSIDAPHPSTLSRQSSHTSQLSRQSSLEHTIVTQSFPMTQRKLLQDPDSGQYFFVDMPVQVKTKTFFDPETGSYVQLPVKPPEGAIPQASPIDVLTPPLVVYHGFVPVPLSPMAQKATVQASHMEPEEFEKRCLERSRQMQNKEGHPYLEPVYGQHDQMIGEFIGTEELDCPS
ncbi:cardiac-enriched FHL2-interacting protein [Echeneis naucrates]|uniref:cardiac-enriched FHL2-interacting protein n=1 Tax=Echeneis naucrates TaxID=173247 RepID=UPI00111374F7|nr:cardiac-enriched FHL2-interacting protein [Echeneis naucrates]XP_029384069.1 cardiac-enriched FHL2-interacting protein [Echeneis naucrates]